MTEDRSQARTAPRERQAARPVNGHELRLVGMSRSGNHAIINWILRQASGRSCFLNCVEPKTNPFISARPMASGKAVEVNYRPFDLRAEQVGRFTDKDWLIYNYEDCFLGMVCHRDFERHRTAFVGASERSLDILVLRDPFNLFASRMDRSHSRITPATTRRIWIQHAREYLGLRHHLPRHRLTINYNRWVIDKAYRRSIAEALGLAFTDEGIDRVAATAGGSSFDGLRYDGQASRMKVFQRWTRYVGDSAYRALFSDEVVDLSNRIFGKVAGDWPLRASRRRRQDRLSPSEEDHAHAAADSFSRTL